jgi:hypothetical protein
MEYMFLIHRDENLTVDPASPGFGEWMASWIAYNEMLATGGHLVSGGQLTPTTTASTVHKAGGTDTLVDGPFMETKEQLGGWYVVEAADLDEAIALAKAMPLDPAHIEIRAVIPRIEAA